MNSAMFRLNMWSQVCSKHVAVCFAYKLISTYFCKCFDSIMLHIQFTHWSCIIKWSSISQQTHVVPSQQVESSFINISDRISLWSPQEHSISKVRNLLTLLHVGLCSRLISFCFFAKILEGGLEKFSSSVILCLSNQSLLDKRVISHVGDGIKFTYFFFFVGESEGVTQL
jgi:hypothetical protein